MTATLLSDARALRDQAFQLEALPWMDAVHRFALTLTRDASDADDLLQETFLRAYRSWHTYTPGTGCRRWLFTICRNVFRHIRSRDAHVVEMGDCERDALAAGIVFREAARDGIEDLFTRLDLAPAISDALAQVPEPFRSAVILVDVEDQTYETAAELLRVPIGTVRSRLFRGRRLMQELLLDYARDAGLVAADAQRNAA